MSSHAQLLTICVLLVASGPGDAEYLATMVREVAKHLHIRDVFWLVDSNASIKMMWSSVQRMKWFHERGNNVQVLTYSMILDTCGNPKRIFDNEDCYHLNSKRQERLRAVSTRPLIAMELSTECQMFLTKTFDPFTYVYMSDMGWLLLDYRINPVWIVYAGNELMENLFAKLIIDLSQTFLVARNSIDGGIELEDVYHLEDPSYMDFSKRLLYKRAYSTEYGANPVIGHWGSWDATHGLDATTVPLLERRSDLKGVRIRFSTVNKPPITTAVLEGGRMTPKGVMYEVWNSMQRQLNFTTEFLEQPKMRNLFIVEVILGVADVFLSDEISHSVRTCDYSRPLYVTRIDAMLRDISVTIDKWDLYLNPFSFHLWMAFLLCLITLALVLRFIQLINGYYGIISMKEASDYTITRTILNLTHAYFQQGNDNMPTRCSARIVYLSTYLVALILMAAYTSDIIAVLSEQKRVMPFENVESLMKDQTYSVGYDQLLFANLLMKNTTIGHYLKSRLQKYGFPKPYADDIGVICNGPSWQLMERNEKLYYANAIPCDVVTIPTTHSIAKSITFSKGLTSRVLLRKMIVKLTEGGMIQKLLHDVRPKTMPPPEQVDVPGITIEILRPILVVLFIGIFIAFSTCVCEAISFRTRRRKL